MLSEFDCPACGQRVSADVTAGNEVTCPLCQQTVTVPPSATPPTATPGPAAMSYAASPNVPLRQGLAVAALVFGLIGFITCPVVGIIAVILGIVALTKANRHPQRYGGKGLAIGGICTGAVGMIVSLAFFGLMAGIAMPSFTRARETAKRTVCAANLRGLGTALYTYGSENDGAMPADLDVLVGSGSVDANYLFCPSSNLATDHYILITGVTEGDPLTTAIAYENLENHSGEGGNIIFKDGHVEWQKAASFKKILAPYLGASP